MKRLKSLVSEQSQMKHLSARLFHPKTLVLSQSTPYEVIGEFYQTRIRYYAATQKRFKEPLVFVAPLAINMAIYDLYPYRSLIKYFQNAGFDVYLVDWGSLKFKDRHLNFLSFIEDFIPKAIEIVRTHSGSEQISLHGWSMAGIFVTLYTALNQPNYIKNLIVLGSPIDSYASGYIGKLYRNMNHLIGRNKKIQDRIYSGLPKRLIHSPGILNSFGFKILDPKGWFDGHVQLLKNLDNLQFVQEHATLSSFLNNMIDYPGGINQDMLFNIWLQNPLKRGFIQLKDKKIELKNIDCSLLVGAGRSDQLVTADAASPLSQLTSSQDVTFTLIPGGHLGLMSSQASALEFWPQLAKWLTERSTQI
ncbi:poly(R)-hydroxyalkanoic acid synthase, class III, PhaC subunit [Acinetobacter calcoaceticus RUH2202]|uniref:alpha/beta fold hydrolase n=1 Tax=Acinetobacter calcoaceticus TaxID=471 RepID=UPI0001BB4F51|nr:alpha/beta fold hydrolase [Acinetobacter calcoaceticus]EEY78080.1 poly(R)-hydroxyalkanoic acid synthase, class III, PhaC subunit [Acinetobacter calcoaceticus RUH2202]